MFLINLIWQFLTVMPLRPILRKKIVQKVFHLSFFLATCDNFHACSAHTFQHVQPIHSSMSSPHIPACVKCLQLPLRLNFANLERNSTLSDQNFLMDIFTSVMVGRQLSWKILKNDNQLLNHTALSIIQKHSDLEWGCYGDYHTGKQILPPSTSTLSS